jgi:hypothetical protein
MNRAHFPAPGIRLKARPAFPAKLECLFDVSRYKIIYGGRGSGKSWSVARALPISGTQRPLRILCGREFDCRQRPPAAGRPDRTVTALRFLPRGKSSIIGANGSEFRFAGIRHNISKIKSFEGFDIVWIEEGQTVSKNSFDVLIPTIRKAGSEIWITLNRDLEQNDVWQRFLAGPPRPDAIIREINWADNAWLTDELRAEKDHLKARDLDAYENVWGGRCRSHVQNALWKMEIFGPNRERAPETEKERDVLLSTLRRVVIAIDPSGCAGEDDKRSDEVGIVVAGVGHDGIARILEDATGRYSPDQWANKALALFDRWKADRIVAETNYGGAMMESTIHTARRTAPVRLVTASRGKVQRAEPVAAIYGQGKVRHVAGLA